MLIVFIINQTASNLTPIYKMLQKLGMCRYVGIGMIKKKRQILCRCRFFVRSIGTDEICSVHQLLAPVNKELKDQMPMYFNFYEEPSAIEG